jgi:signal transduction histidine kinase
MNLVINAAEAAHGGTGTVSISTGCIECSRSYLAASWIDDGCSEGNYVFLDINDSGCGMDGETISRMFDPFFSTKFIGRGLGMATVLGIVRNHRGALRIESEPGKGSTFRILLPAYVESTPTTTGDNHD